MGSASDHGESVMTIRRLLTCAATVYLSCTAGRGYSDDNVTADQVAREWDARERLVKSATLKWTVVETRTKASQADFFRRQEERPDKDLLLKANRSLTVDGKMLRLEHDGQMWSPKSRTVEPLIEVSTFDGKHYAHTILKCPIVDNPVATIRSAGAAENELRSCAILPVWYSLRGSLLEGQDLSIHAFTPTGKRMTVNGRPCHELVRESKGSGKKEQLFIDTERAFQVVRSVDSAKGRISIQIDISYRPHEPLGWIPASWEFVWRMPNGDLGLAVHCKLTEFTLNPSVSSAEFAPVEPPGSRVRDLSSGSEVQYGVLPDGTKGREIRPSGKAIEYRDLMAQPGWQSDSWRPWLTIGLIGGLVVCLVLLLRWGRRAPAVAPEIR